MSEKSSHQNDSISNYFFDAQSTTPIDETVLKVINTVFRNTFANPHSSHRLGLQAGDVINESVQTIKETLKCNDHEIIFTSGATESNNFIIKGLRDYLHDHQLKALTIKTEHKCVLNSFDHLERNGVEVVYLDVEKDGLINLDTLERHLNGVGFISIMYVNNEIGVVQPLKEISSLARSKGIIFHSDIAQAMGRLPVDFNKIDLDAVSISGHKFYGPKGVGLAIINQELKSILKPIIHGGGQQSNLRSGTLPTALCAGLAKCIELYQNENFLQTQHLNHLKLFNHFLQKLNEAKISYTLNGSKPSEELISSKRLPCNLNIAFEKYDATSFMSKLSSFMISTGSACSAGEFDYSHVLRGLELSNESLQKSVRISFDKDKTLEDIDKFLNKIISIHQ
tara:strand:- start:175 stop:1359 length:1185 start_codon:yes stop_codon:yes gene_type:complete